MVTLVAGQNEIQARTLQNILNQAGLRHQELQALVEGRPVEE